jgi:hypothetical protein
LKAGKMTTTKKYRREYIKKNPWVRHFNSARNRCVYKYGHYYGKVNFLMTLNDFKILWIRDNAHLLKRPSIDRIDNSGDYTLSNCRFIELSDNVIRRRMVVIQYNKKGKFIKRWVGITLTEKLTGIKNIGNCTRGLILTAGGYIWKKEGHLIPQKDIDKIQKLSECFVRQ